MRSGVLIALCWLALANDARADRLVEIGEIARGDYLAARFSPDGRELAVSGPKFVGIQLVAVDGSAPVRAIVGDAAAGVHARWRPDGTIEYRAVRAGAWRDLVVDRGGRVRTLAAAAAGSAIASAHDDDVFVRDRSGVTVKVGSGDRFFGPVVSPDGDKVAFVGLVTGIHIYVRSTGALIRVGSGTAPAWSPDSTRLVFERTEDDGHVIVASELFVYRLAARRLEQLTATEDRIERRPSFAPDGARIAFDDDAGAIFVGRLEVSR